MNLFAAAKPVAEPVKKGKKAPAIPLKGVEELAALNATIDALKALASIKEAEVKAAMRDRFITLGVEKKAKPDNFDAEEGIGRANCQLKIRSSASALTDEEADLLRTNGVTVKKNIKRQGCFIFNPAYKDDQDLLEKLSKAISKIKDMPADLIERQTEDSSLIVGEDAINEVFAKGDASVAELLLDTVSTLAIKDVVEADKLDTAMTKAIGMLGQAKDALAAAQASKGKGGRKAA